MKCKANQMKGYIVWNSFYCKWCDNFIPFSGNGNKTCRLYELGKCKFKDKRSPSNEMQRLQ
jgi:hypothetical protein